MLRAQTCAAGALLLAAGLGLLAWSAQHRAARLAQAARTAEQRALKAEGLRAAEAASAARLRREVASLREQIGRARRAVPGLRTQEVVRWRTREVTVPCGSTSSFAAGRPPAGATRGTLETKNPGGADRSTPAPPDADSGSEGIPTRPAGGANFIRLRFEGLDARLESRAGTRVAVGELAVYRTFPPPEELVARVPWQVDLHLREGYSPSARWGVGPLVGIMSGNAAWGAVAEAPPVRVLGLKARPLAFAMASGDDWLVAGGLVIH